MPVPPRIKPGDPSAYAVLSSLKGAALRMRACAPEARRGEGEGIHKLRTSTRRLRSELRAFRGLLDARWCDRIAGELKWLAGLLGAVRDLDVLVARLRKAAAKADGSDQGPLAPLFGRLEDRHARALAALREGLQGDRYLELLVAIEREIEHPELRDEAWEPCRTALTPLASSAWRRLKKAARDLRPSDPDEDFHEVRKRAKRARYTAELIAPALGHRADRGARRFIRRTTRVQDVLGEHQDAVVAGREIGRTLGEHGDDPSFSRAAGRLLETQRDAAREARAEFFDIWEKLDRKRSHRWMDIASKVQSH